MTRTKKTATVLALAVSLGLALAGIVHAQQKTMSIGTGGTGGVYYPLGGAGANVLSKALPNVTATAEVTGGSIDNLKLIGAGQSEMAFTMADAALDAMQGNEKFKNNKVALQTLLVTLATLILTIVLYILVPKGFFPLEDTGVILGISEAPEDTSFSAMADGSPYASTAPRCRT